MKKISGIILLLLLIHCLPLPAQKNIRGAVTLGMNLSQVDGDRKYGYYKPGLHIGPSAIIEFTNSLYVSIETLFSQLGAYGFKEYYLEKDNGDILTGEYKLRLDYVKVPVLFHIVDKRIIGFAIGGAYGRLVNVKEWEHGKPVKTTFLQSKTYALNDYNILSEIRFRLYDRFWLGIRYSYSLAKIRTRDFYNIYGEYVETRDQYNNSLAFRITYIINDEVPSKTKKLKK